MEEVRNRACTVADLKKGEKGLIQDIDIAKIPQKLIDLEKMWGSEATCIAIELAHENKVNNIKYIQAILKNSNGRPMKGKKKEDEFHGYANFADYVAGVLRGEPEYKPDLHRSTERQSALRHISDPG